MRAHTILIAGLTLLAACSSDTPRDPERVSPADSPAVTVAGASSPPPFRRPAGIASMPDRGNLVAYDETRQPIRRGAYRWHPVRLSEEHALKAVVGADLVITGPDGRPIRLQYTRHVEHKDGNWTWIGRPHGAQPGNEAILTFGEHAVFGSIPFGDRPPLKVTMAGGQSWLMETDATALRNHPAEDAMRPDFRLPPKVGGATTSAGAPVDSATAVAATATAATTVDLLLGYTGAFANRLGGNSQAVTRLTYLVDLTNLAYANSQVDAEVRLVRTVRVTYPDATANETALYDLTGVECTEASGGGLSCSWTGPPASLEPLHQAREESGADLVSLVRNFSDPENDGCGIAWLNGGGQTTIGASDAVTGFSVVSDSNGTGEDSFPDNGYVCRDETLAHELGHNMGSAHDLQTAKGSDGILQANEYGRYPYSFGHKTGAGQGNFFTIMSYGDSGQTPYRVFSNPDITYCGGLSCGVAEQADNARSLRATMPIIAAFRAAATPPPPAHDILKGIDVNGNRRSDLFFFDHAASDVTTWLIEGLTRTGVTNSVVPGAARVHDAADFNDDGKGDLLLANAAGNVFVATSNGSTFNVQQVATDVPDGYVVAAAGDVDGNRKADILLRNLGTGRIVVWYMSGASRVAFNGHAFPADLEFVGTGDFDGDGRGDILWSDPARNVLISLSTGYAFSTASTGLAYQSAYRLSGAHDVNGDGRADIILHSSSLNRVVVWYMNAYARYAYNGSAAPVGAKLVGKGDFDGNRRGDLVWRYTATGNIRLFLGNGAGFATAALGYTPPAGALLMDVPL